MVEIKRYISNDNLHNAIKDFFSKVPFGRYLTDPLSKKQKAIDLEIENLKIFGKTGELFIASKGQRVVGIIAFKISEWDTEHFEQNVAKVPYFIVSDDDEERTFISNELVQKFDEWTAKEKIQFVIAKIDTFHFAPVSALQKSGFIFYECITERIIRNTAIFAEEDLFGEYRYVQEEDLPTLRAIASNSTFRKSHFYLDERIQKEKVDSLYEKWIESAFNSDAKIIVIEDKGQIAGMFIFRINGYDDVLERISATWDFAAVSPDFRSKGIGKKIFKSALHACIDNGAEIIDTTLVEKNIISQKIHEDLGFKILNTYYTFHKWISGNDQR